MTKIGRFRGGGRDFWGVLAEGVVRPLAGPFVEWAAVVTAGGELRYDAEPLPLAELRLLAPVTRTARIFGVGGTYREHLRRLQHVLGLPGDGGERPQSPGAFLKPVSCIVDPESEIAYPPTTSELDYEIELVAVVGRSVANGAVEESILGYTIGNDVSARDAKNRQGRSDFFSMKALDRTAPLGPWITARDELGAAPDLELRLTVNGELRQHDRTANMTWTVAELVEYINERVAVQPGDLIFTGTTAGVAWEDGRYLQPGDVVEAWIEGIGMLRNTVGTRST